MSFNQRECELLLVSVMRKKDQICRKKEKKVASFSETSLESNVVSKDP